MNAYYLTVIVLTLVGFCGLAWLLLAPIWRFLDREKQVSDEWTKEALARRRREHGDGSRTAEPPRPSANAAGDDAQSPSSRKSPKRPTPPDT